MQAVVPIAVRQDNAEILQSLLTVGVQLSACPDIRRMLSMILAEARKLARAEAGSLYIVREGKLRFAACQNDRLDTSDITEKLLDRETVVSRDSLAGFVASSGRIMNIPNAYELSSGGPFRHNRQFDVATGYRTVSILAIPLNTPDGQCVGVLQLINRIGADGQIVPFPRPRSERGEIQSLAAMAGVTIHNALLQEQLKQAHLESVIRLSTAAEFKDMDTAQHIRRISNNSAIIARAVGMPPDQVEMLRYASPMHDIGKLGIPDAILLKPGKLTEEERLVMQSHTRIGAEILGEAHNDMMAMAHSVAMWHHERWDGRGYPDALREEQIPIFARIVCLADTFDAMISRRCYKEPCSLEISLGTIRAEEGRQFDPSVCRAFFDTLDEVLASNAAPRKADPLLADCPA